MLKKCIWGVVVAFGLMSAATPQENGILLSDLSKKIETCLNVEPATQKNNFIIAACLLSLLVLADYQAQPEKMPSDLKSQFIPQNLAVNFASNYLMNFAVTLFHEFGHGLAKKILTGSDFKIHLGKNSDNKVGAIFDSKCLSIEGFDPMAGFNTAEGGLKQYSKLQKCLINLSGGVAGILGYFILRVAIFFVSNNCLQNKLSFSQNIKIACHDAITFDQIVLNQLLNLFIPMAHGNSMGGDAVAVWRALGFKDKSIKAVAEIQPYLAMMAFIALAFKQAGSDVSDKRFVADKILIGLSNYFLQGYLQFKSA